MKNLRKLILPLAVIFAGFIAAPAIASHITKIYFDKNGNREAVDNTGLLEVLTGGTLQVDSGGLITVAAGGGTGIVQPAGMLYVATPTSANGNGADTTEDTLATYSLPASTFAGRWEKTLRIKAWGSTATNSDNKTMKLYFGASVVTTPTAATSNKNWFLECDVVRGATASTQAVVCDGQVDTTNVTPLCQRWNGHRNQCPHDQSDGAGRNRERE